MFLNIYLEVLSYLNCGFLIDVIIAQTLFFMTNVTGAVFFNASVNFITVTILDTSLLNVKKVSIWRPYFKKDGYMGYFIDLIVWK